MASEDISAQSCAQRRGANGPGSRAGELLNTGGSQATEQLVTGTTICRTLTTMSKVQGPHVYLQCSIVQYSSES